MKDIWTGTRIEGQSGMDLATAAATRAAENYLNSNRTTLEEENPDHNLAAGWKEAYKTDGKWGAAPCIYGLLKEHQLDQGSSRAQRIIAERAASVAEPGRQ